MTSHRLHSLLGMGAIAGPLLAFAGARFAGHLPGPASARAAQSDAGETAFTPLARTPLTARQRQSIQPRDDADFTAAYPFYLAPAPSDEPDPVEEPLDEPVPEFIVSSFMGGRNPLVIIDSRPRRIGDDLGDGWTLTSIDTSSRSFTVTKGARTEIIRAE